MKIIITSVLALGLLASPAHAQLTEISRTPLPPPASGIKGCDVVLYRGGDPAAGAEVADTVPAGATWSDPVVRDSLVTDATGAGRTPMLAPADTSGPAIGFWPAADTVAPNTTTVITWGASTATSATYLTGPLPVGLTLSPGTLIETYTSGLAAGDDWGAPLYTTRECR